MNGWLTEVKPPYDAKKLEEVKTTGDFFSKN